MIRIEEERVMPPFVLRNAIDAPDCFRHRDGPLPVAF